MAYFAPLIDLLIAAPDRVIASSEIELTAAEADMLCAGDTPTSFHWAQSDHDQVLSQE